MRVGPLQPEPLGARLSMDLSEAVRFTHVTKEFITPDGGAYTAIRDISLNVKKGEFLSIVGPTGCGKSTLLNLAAGLLSPDQGSVEIFGSGLGGINSYAAYQFQQDVILPWKTAEENVMLGLLFRHVPAAEARDQARDWLTRVGLAGFENRYPHQLSGGMRKRVALAQSLIVEPEILLMDEPFSALDEQTREFMEDDLLEICAEFGKTVMFVTHDLEEAIALADRVVVLSAGPGTHLLGEYAIAIPRPRAVADIRTKREFTDTFNVIWEHLRGEVMKAYARK
jgi:NitT/TauT family transport system ATP-binding protein